MREVKLFALVSELKVLTKERGIVRFGDVMNYAQKELLLDCERQLRETGQIRIIVLKARQIGVSTVIEGIIFVLSILFRDYHSLIVSHEKDSAEGLLTMTRRYWTTYVFKEFYVEKYNGKAHLAWTDRESEIQVATAKNVDAGRSKTIQALHASEVAFWEDPETLMTGLRQAIPTYGITAIFLESTANGVGNYFHRTWNEASKGDSEYTPLFYPWHKHPEYTAQFVPAQERSKFTLEMLDAEEKLLRRMGISDERLIWRRWAVINLCQGDVDKFHQEYPTTPHEAFISTGLNVFPLPSLVAHYEPSHGHRGELLEVNGKLQFFQTETGPLRVFAYPSSDKDWGVYLVGADPTHSTAGDYACAQVINRRTLEVVATLRRKIDPMTFAHDLSKLGYYYNTAVIAPEKTGPGYATIGALNEMNYPRLFQMAKIDSTPGQPISQTYGWTTNRQTKQLAVAHLKKAIMESVQEVGGAKYGLVIHDEQTVTEMRDYVTTADGQGYENADGSPFDDGVMALAIAVTAHNIEPPVPAYDPQERDLSAGPLGHKVVVVEALTIPADGTVQTGTEDPTTPAPTEQRPKGADPAPWEDWETEDDE